MIGSGPIGSEMAQTFARFGSEVVLCERGDRILTREDPEASAVVQKEFRDRSVVNPVSASRPAMRINRTVVRVKQKTCVVTNAGCRFLGW